MSTKFAQNFLPHMKNHFAFLEETAPARVWCCRSIGRSVGQKPGSTLTSAVIKELKEREERGEL